MQPVEGAINFNHPALKGKKPEEIEEIVRVLEAANRSAARQIEDLKKPQPAAPAPAQPVAEPTKDDYWNDPINTLDRMIAKHVGPLRDEVHQARRMVEQPDVRSKLRQQHKHFATLEPIIEQALRERDVDPTTADENTLRSTYFLALGYAQENGIVLGEPAPATTVAPVVAAPANPPAQPVPPPQHRPSAAPLPVQTKAEELGEPTEEERAMMRAYKFKTYAEYKQWQKMDEADVAMADFDQPKP